MKEDQLKTKTEFFLHPEEEEEDLPQWMLACVKPRSEKKFAQYCSERNILYRLPLYKSIKKYPRKKLIFYKPCFPGYVFLYTKEKNRINLYQSFYLLKLIKIKNQKLFINQLESILLAIESGVELIPAKEFKPGTIVQICRGPMQGIVGVIQKIKGTCMVYLSIDFISRGVLVEVDIDNIESL